MLKRVGQLRALLLEMESSLGLTELSPSERDVLYAISAICDVDPSGAKSEAIRAHPLVVAIPPASFHRALRALIDQGYVQPAEHRRAGLYI